MAKNKYTTKLKLQQLSKHKGLEMAQQLRVLLLLQRSRAWVYHSYPAANNQGHNCL